MNAKESKKYMQRINNMEQHYRRIGAYEELERLGKEEMICDANVQYYIAKRMQKLKEEERCQECKNPKQK